MEACDNHAVFSVLFQSQVQACGPVGRTKSLISKCSGLSRLQWIPYSARMPAKRSAYASPSLTSLTEKSGYRVMARSAAFLSTMNINIAFMAATGASVTGVTNSSPLEYAIKKAAVKQAEKTVLLVTGNKFGVTSLFSYATLDQFQTVITDASVPAEYLEKLQEKGIDVQIAGEEKEPSEVS